MVVNAPDFRSCRLSEFHSCRRVGDSRAPTAALVSFCVTCCGTRAVDIDVEGAGTSSAKRRRERRLRAMLRHERQTVAMKLAEHLHHSRQKVEGGVQFQCRLFLLVLALIFGALAVLWER